MSTQRRPFRPNRAGSLPPSLQPPLLRRYQVILHRTPGRDLPSVARTLRTILHLADAEATYRMWETHNKGQTPILTAHQELAELFAEQFQEHGLRTTVEPLE